jgi:hypothetical protein
MNDFVKEPLRPLLLKRVVLLYSVWLRFSLQIAHELLKQTKVYLAEPADGLEQGGRERHQLATVFILHVQLEDDVLERQPLALLDLIQSEATESLLGNQLAVHLYVENANLPHLLVPVDRHVKVR